MGLVLLSGILLYVTTLKAAGMVECLPPERTVCTMTRQELQFPAAVEGTTLRILNTVCYEGAFLENGGDTPVVDVLGIMLENTGESHVRTAWVMLSKAGERFCFFARDLPPGSRTIVLESAGTLWRDETFDSVCGGAEISQEDLLVSEDVEITPAEMGSVFVTNHTDHSLYELELIYKNYLEEDSVYLGGVAYEHRIPILQSGETVTIYPSRYAAGYSRFVRAFCQPEMSQ